MLAGGTPCYRQGNQGSGMISWPRVSCLVTHGGQCGLLTLLALTHSIFHRCLLHAFRHSFAHSASICWASSEFPTAAVVSHRKHRGLQQHRFLLFQFWRSEVRNQSSWGPGFRQPAILLEAPGKNPRVPCYPLVHGPALRGPSLGSQRPITSSLCLRPSCLSLIRNPVLALPATPLPPSRMFSSPKIIN